MDKASRRQFLKSAGAAALGGAAAAQGATAATSSAQPHAHHAGGHAGHAHAGASAPSSEAHGRAYVFFNPQEARFIEAAVSRLIPSDEVGPGAIEADVPGYIDNQLAGAWGAGERLYRSGPWREGTPQQGYQLPFTPAELFRTALRGIHGDIETLHHKTFDELPPLDQDTYLTALQNGERDLSGVPSKVFFESLLAMTLEGFFSDPVYGGNKDMVSWRLIGFPGAYANYYHLVDQHGIAFEQAPMSLAQGPRGVIHIHPDIPATQGKGS